MKANMRSMALTVVVTAVCAFVAAQPCAAQVTRTVGSAADDGGPTTLRSILVIAEDGDTINFAASVTGTILLAPYMGPLQVNKSLTIIGPGEEQLTIDGGFALPTMKSEVAPMNGGAGSGVFWVGFASGEVYPDVTVSISGVTIAHGGSPAGGAILNAGHLTLSECTLRDNVAEYGGAIANFGTLELADCTLDNNVAFYFGGAIYSGDLVATGATLAVTVTRCVLSNNTVTEVYSAWETGLNGGGAIANCGIAGTALVSIEDSVLTGNSAQGGGAINNQSFADEYADPLIPGFAVVTVVRSTLSGNSATAQMAAGGAIYQAGFPNSYATVTLESSTVNGNSAASDTQCTGGGICDFSTGVGNVVLRNSTLANNSALFTENSTPATQQIAFGGAIVGFGSTSIYADNCTLSGNRDAGSLFETTRASGILLVDGPSLTIKNTLLANDASGSNLVAAANSTVTDLGYNLCTDDGSGLLTASGNQLNTNPLLGPLADNGGATWTCALLPGSPAINAAAGTDTAGNAVAFDQRGIARPQGAANDIGAFEVEFTGPVNQAPVLDVSAAPATGVVGVPVKFTATATDDGTTLTYSLLNAPYGASINPQTGAFTWTPLLGYTHTFSVMVTDDGTPSLSDTEAVTINVSALEVSVASVARRGKTITVTVSLANKSELPVAVAEIASAKLAGVPTTSSLPVSAKVIKPGASKSVSLTFEGSAVPKGNATLSLQGLCVPLGSFSCTQMISVP